MSRHPIFVFGTLRWQCGNDRLWHGRAVSHHDGRAYVIGQMLVSNGAFPYMVPSATGHTVGGLIVPRDDCYDDVLADMDDLEGVPWHYTRSTIAVMVPGAAVTAWTYLPGKGAAERAVNLPAVPTNDDAFFDWRLANRYLRERTNP